MTDAERQDATVPARWSASTVRQDMWVDPDDDPRDSGVALVDERAVLLEYLGAYRATLEMKCEGLDAAQLARRSVPPSTMSLLGIVRHMAGVEQHWFRRVTAGEDVARLFASEDPWNGAVADPGEVDEAWRALHAEIAAAEELVGATSDLGHIARLSDGATISLREVLVHMIEEYARHCGHADLLRERIDGRVGQ